MSDQNVKSEMDGVAGSSASTHPNGSMSRTLSPPRDRSSTPPQQAGDRVTPSLQMSSHLPPPQQMAPNAGGTSQANMSPTPTSMARDRATPAHSQPSTAPTHLTTIQSHMMVPNHDTNLQPAGSSHRMALPVTSTPPSGHPTAASARPSTASSVLGIGLFSGSSHGPSSSEADRRDADTSTANPSQLGGLHQRRSNTSPEKFNTGQFEPLPLRTSGAATAYRSHHQVKRQRLEDGIARPSTPLTAALDMLGIAPPQIKKSDLTADIQGLDVSEAAPKAFKVPLSALASPSTLVRPKTHPPLAFSLLSAFCKHNQLLLHLTSFLTIPALTSLYAISKVFHHQMNCHHTSFIMAVVRTWAPGSESVYPWRCYKSLCIKDPRLRQKSKWIGREAHMTEPHQDLRDIPSLRWLQMVIYRHGVCKDMLMQLASYGHRCPRGTLDALKRIWFMLDLPLNAHRLALIRTQSYISDDTLKYATMFFLKLDMDFTNPSGAIYPANHQDQLRFPQKWANMGFTGTALRETLLAEKSLTPLWRVLRGWSWDPEQPRVHMDQLDMLRLWVRHYYKPRVDLPDPIKKQDIMGVPWYKVGTAGLERFDEPYEVTDLNAPRAVGMLPDGQTPVELPWTREMTQLVVPKTTRKRNPLLRPDELAMRESLRRDLGLDERWVEMMIWGWFDPFGRTIPVLTEGMQKRVQNGLHPKPEDDKVEEVMVEGTADEATVKKAAEKKRLKALSLKILQDVNSAA